MKNERSENKKDKIRFQIGNFTPQSLYAISLIPLLDALGWKGSNTDLLEAIADKPDEMNQEGLLKTLANLHYEGKEKKKIKSLRLEGMMPCLCVSFDNVLTLIAQDREGYHVYDAAEKEYTRIRKLPPDIRTYYVFNPLDQDRFSLLKPQTGWFGQVLMRFKKEFSYTILLSFLMTVFSFITPLFVMLIYSQLQSADSSKILFFLGVAVFVFILSLNGLKFLRSYLLAQVSERIGNIISNEVFRRLLYLPPQYTEVASVQQQTNRIRDFETIKDFFAGNAFTSLIDAPLSLLLLVGLFVIGGPLALIPLASVFIFFVSAVLFYRAFQRVSQQGASAKNRKVQIQNEMLTQMPLIRRSGYSKVWFDRLERFSRESAGFSLESSAYIQMINALAKGLSAITLVLTISFAVLRVLDGHMTGGALFACFLITSRLLAPISSGFTVFSQFSRYQRSVQQLNRLMNLAIEVRPQTMIKLHKQMEGDIVFKNVFLKYSKESAPALMNISFRIQAGETIAIVGHGGSGKSSILKLIMGMYTSLSGSILMDNVNLKQIDTIRLRKSMAYIPTRGFRFSGSLRDNLYLARPDASDRIISDALRHTGLDLIIDELPGKLDTDLNDLPASQDQNFFYKMLNLTQALLRNAPICLIDELERGLTKDEIDRAVEILEKLKKQKTIVMVSNNNQIINLADKCLWIDNGRIMKYGPRADIMNFFDAR